MQSYFWALFIIALVAGFTIGAVFFSENGVTGYEVKSPTSIGREGVGAFISNYENILQSASRRIVSNVRRKSVILENSVLIVNMEQISPQLSLALIRLSRNPFLVTENPLVIDLGNNVLLVANNPNNRKVILAKNLLRQEIKKEREENPVLTVSSACDKCATTAQWNWCMKCWLQGQGTK